MTTPSSGKAWWIVFVLFMASAAAGLDREIFGLTVDSVRGDLGITDVQISLLQGLSFSLFYATAGLFCGYISDRVSRKWLLTFGLTVWTLATIGSGLAHGFTTLFLTRMLTGLGEATLIPVSVSTITDLFPPDKRGRPIGIYLLGQVFGGGISIMVSGVILTAAKTGGFAGIPFLESLGGWRIIFILSGVAGFAVVFLLLTMIDVPRTGSHKGTAAYSARESFAFLRANRRIFAPLYLGYAVASIMPYGLSAWSPTFLIRHFALSPKTVGTILGIGLLAFGPLATISGGFLVDRIARRDGVRRKLVLMAILSLCMLPAALTVFCPFPLTGAWIVAIDRMMFSVVTIGFLGVIQDLAPAPMRGLAVSICGLTNAVVGATCGPMLIALSTEKLFHDPMLVGYGIATVVVPALLIAAILFMMTRRALKHFTVTV